MTRAGLLALGAAALAAAGWLALRPGGGDGGSGAPDLAALVVPQFDAEAQAGARLFAENCAACHGEHATGSDQGPPLVHPIYKPSHHADFAFQLALKQGVRAHHWGFGNMPPQPDVREADAARITAYVRALQKANGVF